jgi:HEAT repeat protein
MLEALGIGARGKENALYARLLDNFTVKWSSRFGQLLWELRPSDALPKLIVLLKDDSLSVDERAEVLDALSAQAKPEAALAVAEFVQAADQPQELVEKSFARLSQQLYSEWTEMRSNPVVLSAVRKDFRRQHSRPRHWNWPVTEDSKPGCGSSGLAKSDASAEALVRRWRLGRTKNEAYLAELEPMVQSGEVKLRVAAVRAIGSLKAKNLEPQMKKLLL